MASSESQSGLIGNRYRIEEVLGSGGMGEVYRVTDLLEDDRVKALKTLPEHLNAPDVLERFKIEFETLAGLNHPNLEKVYDFEYDSDRKLHYFTAEYIPGKDFLEAVDGLSFADLASLTVQVCRALAYLHTRGIVHFDVKPTNILVSPDRSSVRLIDFGLAGAQATELFGTPGYMAPEIFREGEVDRRADLYALGVVLYQAVTGEFPYRSKSTASIVQRQLEDIPVAPARLNPKIPKPLERIVLKLLQAEPSDRYSSAQEVILAINEGLGTEHEVETTATSEGYVLTSRLVGREGEIGRLQEIFKASVNPASAPYGRVPTLTLLLGEPGVGKTRLAKELRWTVQLRGSAFIECVPDPATGSPLGFLSTAIHKLLALAGEDESAAGGRGVAPAGLPTPAEAAGEKGVEEGPAENPSALFERIARFLVEVSHHQPYVLYLRDLHLLGPGHADLLGHLVRSVNLWRREGGEGAGPVPGEEPRLMLLATADRDEILGNTTLQKTLGSLETLNLLERIDLAPLKEHQITELVESLIGHGGEVQHLAKALFKELGGNPLAVIETMKFLLDEGVLKYGEGGWVVDRESLDRPGGIPTVSKAFAIRAGHLDPKGRRILDALAVIDDRVGLDVLETVLEEDSTDLLRKVIALEKAGFLQGAAEGSNVEYALTHPRLRDVLYDGLEEGIRRRLHSRMGSYLEGKASIDMGADTWGRMAVHFSRSGETAKAREYATRAADHFRKSKLHGEAARFLGLLLDLSDTEEQRREAAFDLATELCGGNECKSALKVLEKEVPDRGRDAKAGGRFHHLMARAYSGLGRHEEALAHLGELDVQVEPGAPEGMALSSLTLKANILTHLTRYEEARELCEARLKEMGTGASPRARALVLDCMAFLHRAKGDLQASIECQEQVMEISRKLDERSLSFQSTDGMCSIHSLLGNYRESIRYGREAVRLARGMGDLQAEVTSYGNLAMSFTALWRFRTALRLFKRANRLAERIGDIHKLGVSFFNIANVLDGLGQVHKGTGPYLRSIELAAKVGDKVLETVARVCFSWHQLMLWDVEEAGRILKGMEGPLEKLDNPYCTAMYFEIRARLLHHRGLLAPAEESVERALDIYAKLGHEERIKDSRRLLARVLGARGEFERAERIAREQAEVASKKGFGSFEGEAFQVLGELAVSRGRFEEGESHLERAATIFHKLRCAGFGAKTLLNLASAQASRKAMKEAAGTLERAGEFLEVAESDELSAEFDFVKGILAKGRGEAGREEAIARLESAVSGAEAADCADLIWRGNLELAALFESTGRREEARPCYGKIRDVFERMSRGLEGASLERLRNAPHRAPALLRIREFEEGVREAFRRGEGELPAAEESPPHEDPLPLKSLSALAPLVEREGNDEEKRRFDELRSATVNSLRLQEILSAGSRERDLNRVLTDVLDAAIDFTGAQRGFLILNDYWGEGAGPADMHFVATRNFDREKVRSPEFKISASIMTEVGRTGKPAIVDEAALDPRFSHAGSVYDLSLRSVACFPLQESGRTIGVLYLDNRFRAATFSEKDFSTLQTLTQHAASVIERARLYRGVLEERKRVEELNVRLGELNRELQDRINTQLLEMGEIRQKLRERDRDLSLRYSYENIIGRSPAMQKIFGQLDKVIGTDLPVLITGPTGSGKELVARSIHYQGRRKEARLVTENCAALPETLLESELFGYVKGAFTGASEDKKGLLELADGGTLFLDEIGEMSAAMQAKLLRALEMKEIRRVGGKETLALDIRLITATNRDLAKAVRRGDFREDLFYRLNTFTIHVPPLKKRPEDIPLLADHFLGHFAELKGVDKPEIPRRVMEHLLDYSWPGNVRELKNEIERLVALFESGDLSPHDLSPPIAKPGRGRSSRGFRLDSDTRFDAAVTRFEIEFLRRALDENDWNVAKTANVLGVNRMKLTRKMKKYGLER